MKSSHYWCCLLQESSIAANSRAAGDSDPSLQSQTQMDDASGQTKSPQQVRSLITGNLSLLSVFSMFLEHILMRICCKLVPSTVYQHVSSRLVVVE